ncbi:hypothetical protein D6L39_24270 [Vibrio parahaemolyticus]|nr:hypothetical protein [Vibrio parahaemolyticus]
MPTKTYRVQIYNKAFKSDSQRLAVSLRSSIAKQRSHLNAALYNRPQRSVVHIILFNVGWALLFELFLEPFHIFC